MKQATTLVVHPRRFKLLLEGVELGLVLIVGCYIFVSLAIRDLLMNLGIATPPWNVEVFEIVD
jgi:hypothetical protein